MLSIIDMLKITIWLFNTINNDNALRIYTYILGLLFLSSFFKVKNVISTFQMRREVIMERNSYVVVGNT